MGKDYIAQKFTNVDIQLVTGTKLEPIFVTIES